jgi:phosphopantetheinyl transferase
MAEVPEDALPRVFVVFAPPSVDAQASQQEACWSAVEAAFGEAGRPALAGEAARIARKLLPADRYRGVVGLWLLSGGVPAWGAGVPTGWRRAASGQPLPPDASYPPVSLSHHGACVAVGVGPSASGECAVGLDVVCLAEAAHALGLADSADAGVADAPAAGCMAGVDGRRVHGCDSPAHRLPFRSPADVCGRLAAFRAVLSESQRDHIAAVAASEGALAGTLEFAHAWTAKEAIGKASAQLVGLHVARATHELHSAAMSARLCARGSLAPATAGWGRHVVFSRV